MTAASAVTLPNWNTSSAELVIIRARQIIAGADDTYYTPELQIVIDDQTDGRGESKGYIVKLDRRYDTVHELIMNTSMWADKMFNRVDQFVVVVAEDGTMIEMIDVKTHFCVELAEQELHELKRNNNHAIH